MKSILVLISILISTVAFADNQLPNPNCKILRKASVHFTVYKYTWTQNDYGSESHHEVVCNQTLPLDIYEVHDNCNETTSLGTFTCSVVLNNTPTTVTLLGNIDVVHMNNSPAEKNFFASYFIGIPGGQGKHRQISLITKSVNLKDATLYIPADQTLLPNTSVVPDDLALEVTFEDPNAR